MSVRQSQQQLENAVAFVRMSGQNEACRKFSVGRKRLASYRETGLHKTMGRPTILTPTQKKEFEYFLLSTESATDTQFTQKEIGEWMMKFSVGEKETASRMSVHRYLTSSSSVGVKSARPSDFG